MATLTLKAGCYYITDSLYGLFNYEKASATTRSFWEMISEDGSIIKEIDGVINIDIDIDTRSSAGAYFSGDLYIVNHDLVQLTPKGIDCLRFSESVEAVITSTTENDEVVLSVNDEYFVCVFKTDDYDESSDDYYSSDDEDEPEPEASSDYQDSDK